MLHLQLIHHITIVINYLLSNPAIKSSYLLILHDFAAVRIFCIWIILYFLTISLLPFTSSSLIPVIRLCLSIIIRFSVGALWLLHVYIYLIAQSRPALKFWLTICSFLLAQNKRNFDPTMLRIKLSGTD